MKIAQELDMAMHKEWVRIGGYGSGYGIRNQEYEITVYKNERLTVNHCMQDKFTIRHVTGTFTAKQIRALSKFLETID